MAQAAGTEYVHGRQLQKTDWTFLDKSTGQFTHKLHLYPARMHPEIAKRVIAKYARNETDVVFDPFMGSGGVLLEGILHGNHSIGIDVNPFAVLLSKVKTTPIRKDLSEALKKIASKSARDYLDSNYHPECLPKRLDVDNWYKPDVANTLAVLKHHIFKIRDLDVRDFFKVCFSLAARRSSYQRNGAWKIHRMPESDRLAFNPNPVEIFRQVAQDNIGKMNELVDAAPKGRSHTLLGDSRNVAENFSKIEDGVLQGGKAHLVVTSPPYGDHGTTVAYGQFSKHSSLWLELPEEQALSVDKAGLGGRRKADSDDLGSETLNGTLEAVRRNDARITKNKRPCRTESVYSYFCDLDECMDEISKNLVPEKSHCCFVVANRTVRRVVIPTDTITVELASRYGFRVEKMIHRSIPNKAMPSKNAPENVSHDTGDTMTRESVIIMRY